MLRQSLPKPSILPVIRPDYQYEVVSCRIVGVEKIGYESEEPKTAGKDNKLILLSKLLK
jgi:hypothetical protein